MCIDRIDQLKAIFITFACTIFGTALNGAEPLLQIQVNTDPAWFIQVSPVLQCCAWCVAIIAGTITIIKSFRNGKENKRKHGRR